MNNYVYSISINFLKKYCTVKLNKRQLHGKFIFWSICRLFSKFN